MGTLWAERRTRVVSVDRRRRRFRTVIYDENTTDDVVLDPVNQTYLARWGGAAGAVEQGQSRAEVACSSRPTAAPPGQAQRGAEFRADGLGRIGSRSPIAGTACSRVIRDVVYPDDAGEHWYRATTDTRVATRESDFAEVKVDPKNPDIVYTASVVTWKSTDGGKTFAAFRGAPGGDDYHRIWINPKDSRTMIIASDQGAIVTVNGGATWSSWLNQPTAAFYHVAADNAFPYRLCSGQQESGSACVDSRGDDGRILDWNWHPAGIEEYGYAAPDPLDRTSCTAAGVARPAHRTGAAGGAARGARRFGFRSLRTAPLVFSTVDRTSSSLARTWCGRRSTAASAGRRSARSHADRLGRAAERGVY